MVFKYKILQKIENSSAEETEQVMENCWNGQWCFHFRSDATSRNLLNLIRTIFCNFCRRELAAFKILFRLNALRFRPLKSNESRDSHLKVFLLAQANFTNHQISAFKRGQFTLVCQTLLIIRKWYWSPWMKLRQRSFFSST